MSTPPTANGLARAERGLLDCLPRFSRAEQSLALALYPLLARGEPVPRERLARVLDRPTPAVVRLLDGEHLRSQVVYGARRAIVGFGGLAVVPMHHRLLVGHRTLYTWCAWDALFLPEILRTTARVTSTCPETGATIDLTVSRRVIESATHPDAVLSFLLPTEDAFVGRAVDTMTNFCRRVFFLATRTAGERWAAHHQGTFLLTLDEAFLLGQRKNPIQFSDMAGAR